MCVEVHVCGSRSVWKKVCVSQCVELRCVEVLGHQIIVCILSGFFIFATHCVHAQYGKVKRTKNLVGFNRILG